MSPQRRTDWLKLCTAAVGFIVIVALAFAAKDFRHDITTQGDQLDQQDQQLDDIEAFAAAGRESRIAFQARETFLLCSRDLELTVTPDRRDDVAEACAGYETLDRAVRTERAKQRTATG